MFKKNKIKTKGHLYSGSVTMEMITVVCFTIIIQQRLEIKREGGREEPECGYWNANKLFENVGMDMAIVFVWICVPCC